MTSSAPTDLAPPVPPGSAPATRAGPSRAVPRAEGVPDRYADAVRARRAELRAARAALLGGQRVDLRDELAARRLAASAELATALAGLDRELRHHADHGDRHARAALPEHVAAAVDRLAARTADRWAASVARGVRRLAVARGLPPPAAQVTAALRRRPAVTLPEPDPPPTAARALLTGATEGTWRLALLPAAALPAVGLRVLGGRSALPLTLGLGLALVTGAVRARRVAADRARLRRWGAEVVATVRGAWETELARRLLDVERRAGAVLEQAAGRRRAEIERELRALAPDPGGGGG